VVFPQVARFWKCKGIIVFICTLFCQLAGNLRESRKSEGWERATARRIFHLLNEFIEGKQKDLYKGATIRSQVQKFKIPLLFSSRRGAGGARVVMTIVTFQGLPYFLLTK
jgi:hypothetical protein